MKLRILERNDSQELISLFNKFKKEGLYPMWNDPYCEFVVHKDNKVWRYHQNGNGKLKKEILGII
jgi:hypothetical protein